MAATVTGIHLGPDTHANRPAANAVPVGTHYYCSDHDLVYITDGSTWTTWLDNTGGGGGAVATDVIWDAKGDIAGGTGADTAAVTSVGADGAMLVADSAQTNGLNWGYPTVAVDKVATGESTTSTSYTDLSTAGPAVTVTVPASGKVRVTVHSQMQNTGTGWSGVGVALSGANTAAASTVLLNSANAGAINRDSSTVVFTGLNAGSTTFTCKYAVQSGTGTFTNREIHAEPVN